MDTEKIKMQKVATKQRIITEAIVQAVAEKARAATQAIAAA